MKEKFFSIALSVTFIFLILTTSVIAQEKEGDLQLFGVDLEEIIGVVVSLFAFILFILTFIAYKRDGRKKFLLVSIAFFLFSLKSIIDASELFSIEQEFFGTFAVVLELFVILFFFFGVITKED